MLDSSIGPRWIRISSTLHVNDAFDECIERSSYMCPASLSVLHGAGDVRCCVYIRTIPKLRTDSLYGIMALNTFATDVIGLSYFNSLRDNSIAVLNRRKMSAKGRLPNPQLKGLKPLEIQIAWFHAIDKQFMTQSFSITLVYGAIASQLLKNAISTSLGIWVTRGRIQQSQMAAHTLVVCNRL